ncbi:hypothetical protein ACFDR9_003567 [Janthinobacterium sp. CG_23.3]|uniref:hypothetical protein n=1 Tax=Janthinobacterium sp. CG_23.3 TaxID=3349634 RepID=UPI0038D379AC
MQKTMARCRTIGESGRGRRWCGAIAGFSAYFPFVYKMRTNNFENGIVYGTMLPTIEEEAIR